MTGSRASKPVKRDRQRITRTACEPCREKRAKCDGEKPCGRCQNRSLDCHFTQRTWASKRSLQDEAASLREQLHRRDSILDAIAASDGSGDDIVRMLREGSISYDEACDRIQDGDTRSSIDAMDTTQQHGPGICDCETCWSPSSVASNMLSSGSGQSPFSFMDNALTDDSTSQPSTISQPATMPDLQQQQLQQQQQSDALQQQMNPMQSIPWAGTGPETDSFGNMLDAAGMPPIALGNLEGPTVIDPMLWPPITSSDPLGQPMLNSWTGLMGDPGNFNQKKTAPPLG